MPQNIILMLIILSDSIVISGSVYLRHNWDNTAPLLEFFVHKAKPASSGLCLFLYKYYHELIFAALCWVISIYNTFSPHQIIYL